MERVAGPERERSSDEAPEEPAPRSSPPLAAAPAPTDLLVPPAPAPPAAEPELVDLAAIELPPPPTEPAPAFTAVEQPDDTPMGPIGVAPVAILGAGPPLPAPPPATDDWMAVGPAAGVPPPSPRIVLRPSARLAPPPPATGRLPHLDGDSLVAPARDDESGVGFVAPPGPPSSSPSGPPPPALPVEATPELQLELPPELEPPLQAIPAFDPPPAPVLQPRESPLPSFVRPQGTGRLNIRILPRGGAAGGAPAGPPPASAPAFAIGSPVEDVSGAAMARTAPRGVASPPPAAPAPARSGSGPRPVTARVQGRIHTGLGGRVRAALRCPYCHDGVERQGGVACARRGCGALYHDACWRECVSHYGGCAVFGCGCRDVKGLTRVGLWVRVARLVLAAVLFPPRVIEALRDEGAGAEEVRRALEARANETDDAFWARTSTRVAPRTRAAWNLLQFAVPCVAMAVTMALLTGTGAIFSRPEAAILLMIAAGIGAVLALHQTSRVAALVVYYARAVLDGEFAALARAGGVGGYLTRMRTGGQKPPA